MIIIEETPLALLAQETLMEMRRKDDFISTKEFRIGSKILSLQFQPSNGVSICIDGKFYFYECDYDGASYLPLEEWADYVNIELAKLL